MRSSINDLDPEISDLDPTVDELDRSVTDADTTEEDDGETVVTLASDIFFDFDSAEINDAAADRIRELVGDIPDGAAVAVHGHTDSKGEDDYNQQLSEDRARTVAEVVSAERGDLEVEVEGFGETRPVASNGTADADDPEGRAKNRRVEIRYDS
nr:OmpA family protein [Brevibacterium daeguense]